MSINSIENATRYSNELDKMFEQKSAVGFFADNALATKFVGAKTVIIPDIDFQGLADYDRDTGFSRGAITVANTSYTMQMDRARSLQIDREDMDETGIANLAGKILGEYVRTKVVPECDAYVLSKLAGLALTRSNIIEGDIEKPFETSPLEPDKNGKILYCACQYIVFGTCALEYSHKIDDVTFRVATSHPDTGIKEEHFVIEFFPVELEHR